MKKPFKQVVLASIMTATLFYSCQDDDDNSIDESVDAIDISDIITGRESVSDVTTQVIADWNTLWKEVDQYSREMRPTATARALAYIHLAGYETAVEDMTNYTTNSGRLDGFIINSSERESDVDVNLALNTCYALVYDHFMFNVESSIDAKIAQLQAFQEADLSVGLTSSEIENSIEWGTYIAEQVIAYSQTDVNAEEQILDPQPYAYEPPTAEGYWTYSADAERAWYPYWGTVRTFVISSEETSTVVPPIDYNENEDSDYYRQMNEVYEVSTTAKEENNEDLWIAQFWSDDVEGLMISPPGRQLSIANQLIGNNDLGFEESLELLIKLGFSLNDAAVSSWADKYEYMVMRPSVYIQEYIDADFQTNLYDFIFWPNPSFPGYPSGHSTFASAAAGVFIDAFGDSNSFTDTTHEGRTEFLGTPRTYSSLSDMAEENAFSRIPLGVHIKMDCTEGYRLGYEISDAVNDFSLTN